MTRKLNEGGRLQRELEKVFVKELDPYTLVNKVFEESLK